MKKTLLVGVIFSIMAGPAIAQQSSSEQALVAKLMQEIQGSLNCSASIITMQTELEKAKAKIKELEAKDAK